MIEIEPGKNISITIRKKVKKITILLNRRSRIGGMWRKKKRKGIKDKDIIEENKMLKKCYLKFSQNNRSLRKNLVGNLQASSLNIIMQEME